MHYWQDLDSSNGRSKERGVTPSPLVKDEWETCLSQLIMGDVLGEGAFGVVCKGLLQDKSREDRWHEVAVKMLKDHSLEEDVQSFQEEIKMMKSVGRHPNIVSIIGCCTQVGKMRLIVEYCSLGDLKKYLRNVWDNIVSAPYPAEVCLANASTNDLVEQVKYAELVHSDSYTPNGNGNPKVINQVENKLYLNTENGDTNLPTKDGVTSAELLSFARQVAFGMEYLSANRVIHRDLAARNVLVCENKTVKISDFGMSRDIYEQNVWSFGILLWEIVTLGGNPYPGTPTNRLLHLLKTGHRMECPNNCSTELYSLMLSCWNAKPKERPTFVELYNKLDLLLEEAIPQEYLNLDPLKVAAYLSLHSRTENTSTIISTSSTESQESLGKPDLTSTSAYPMS
uniref:Protein kinase domain-containing protein n=1 Tax=Timema poppense TaxID=170557 RepID=A0A7R9CZZ5_TIMPO|nr:unnamed protein product [Timema poppensis]